MIQYSIPLTLSQIAFLSENFDNLRPIKSMSELLEHPPQIPKIPGYTFLYKRLPEKDRKIMEEYHSNREYFEKNSRATKLVRSLYGIIGFERYRSNKWFYFHNFFIPNQNVDAINASLRSGIFSKEFPEDDLEILETIYKRNGELRKIGIKRRHPLFYTTEIAKLSGREYKDTVKSMLNLIGLLGLCYNDASDKKGQPYLERRFIVPRAREELIDSLLK